MKEARKEGKKKSAGSLAGKKRGDIEKGLPFVGSLFQTAQALKTFKKIF